MKNYCKLAVILASTALGISAPSYAQQEAAKTEKNWNVLSSNERMLAAQVPDCDVIGRENIVLLWPLKMKTAYYYEANVANREQLADWLERAYELLRDVTFHDPNAANQLKNGERHRLAIVWNGQKNYHFGGATKRPYIGSKSYVCNESWFNYICHEMGHDFFHLHPDFRGRVTGWNEGLAEYMHFYLLQQMGMPETAKRFEAKMAETYRVDPFSPYRGRAYQFVLMQHKRKWESPKQLLENMRGKDTNLFMTGKKEEVIVPTTDKSEALVAAWDFDGLNALEDKATAGQIKDNLTILGDVKVKGGIAIVSSASGAVLRASSSPELELADSMTIWTRFRIPAGKQTPKTSIVSLIDKRLFKNPEARSYGFFLIPSDETESWGLGGQISGDGTRSKAVTMTEGTAAIERGEWCEAAMVVNRVGKYLSVSWSSSTSALGEERDFVLANGPVSRPIDTIFRGQHPLLIGNDSTMGAKNIGIEFDEVRIYNRALSDEELLSIRAGELSHERNEFLDNMEAQ